MIAENGKMQLIENSIICIIVIKQEDLICSH
jgi:hypothetical protein